MKRVMIIGDGGSGKSTLARLLGAQTGLPVHHLDQVFWMPDGPRGPKRKSWRWLRRLRRKRSGSSRVVFLRHLKTGLPVRIRSSG